MCRGLSVRVTRDQRRGDRVVDGLGQSCGHLAVVGLQVHVVVQVALGRLRMEAVGGRGSLGCEVLHLSLVVVVGVVWMVVVVVVSVGVWMGVRMDTTATWSSAARIPTAISHEKF